MDTAIVLASVSNLNPAVFCKGKKIKHLIGVRVIYAAQFLRQIDAEIVEKSGLQIRSQLVSAQVRVDKVPINQLVKKGLKKIRTPVLVVEVVGVFPDINN